MPQTEAACRQYLEGEFAAAEAAALIQLLADF